MNRIRGNTPRVVDRLVVGASVLTAASAMSVAAWADDGAQSAQLKVAIDTVWVILAGALVFFMNAGFALLETGFVRAKNAVNVLAKNFTVVAMAGLAFFFFGFGLMFADGNGFMGLGGWFLLGADNSPALGDAYEGIFKSLNWAGVPLEAKFFFQCCFAMAAASIVSGAVAERIKFHAYLVFSLGLVAVVYGITGHWIWGGGWLASMGFWDFAGSTQVHSVGGWAALAGILILGPRKGKYTKDGIRGIPGHSMALATMGTFILWLGWFGFNAGSTMAADPVAISHIATTTLLASMAGTSSALVAAYLRTKAFDLSMMLNGCLAGLVAVTAGCAFVSGGSAVAIGAVAGVLVVLGVEMFDRLHVDDPVGATSVHLLNGVWGTLAVGLFAESRYSEAVGNGLLFGGGAKLLGAQTIGVAAIGVTVLVSSAILWYAIKATIGVRVTDEEELLGLDITEMRMRAYPVDDAAGIVVMPPEAGVASPQTATAANTRAEEAAS